MRGQTILCFDVLLGHPTEILHGSARGARYNSPKSPVNSGLVESRIGAGADAEATVGANVMLKLGAIVAAAR